MKREKIRNPIGISLDAFTQEHFTEKKQDESRAHPTVEQMMIRQGSRYLTPKQKRVWELYNFDRMTQDEMAVKLSITHQAVCKHIKAAENRIVKYVKDNMGAYNLLKADYNVD